MRNLDVLLLLILSHGVTSQDCDAGWKRSNTNCFWAGANSTWSEARKYCHQNQAEIFNYSQSMNAELTDLFYHGKVWSSGFVKDERLVQAGQQGRLSKYPNQLPQIYGQDPVPLFGNDFGCLVQNISRKTNVDTLPQEWGSGETPLRPTQGVDVVTQFSNCFLQLPYFCSKPLSSRSFLDNVSICPPGWIGSYKKTHCYKLSTDRRTSSSAETLCSVENGELVDDVMITTASQVMDNYYRFDEERETQMPYDLVWVKQSKQGNCSVFQYSTGKTLTLDCDRELPYICSTPVQYKAIPKNQPFLTYTVQGFSLETKRNGEKDLRIQNSTLSGDNLVFKCSLENIDSELQSINWVKDGSYLQTTNASLTIARSELSKMDSLEFRAWTDIFGYYWCEVVDAKTSEIRRSKKIFLDLTGGMKIYAASLQLTKRVVNITAMTFNLLRRNIGLPDIFSPQTETPDVAIKINRFRSNGWVVDFQVFVTLPESETRLFDPYDELSSLLASEQMIKRKIQRADYLIKFVSTEVCMATTVNASFSGEDKNYQVPQTRLGDDWHSNETCLVDGVHMMKLMCLGDRVYGAYWSDPIIHSCFFDKEPKSAVTDELEEIYKDANSDTEDILQRVFELTSNSENLVPLDIIYTSSILHRVSNSSNTISNTDAHKFVGIVNNLQNVPTEILQDAVRQGNVSNRLISSIENMELRLLTNDDDDDDDDDDDTNVQIVTNNVIVAVRNLQDNTENPIIGLAVNGKTSEPTTEFDIDGLSSLYNEQEVIHATTDVGIVLNRTFVRNIIQEKNPTDVRLAFHVLTNSKLFTADGNQHSVNSKIISATLIFDKQPITDLNGSVITSIFYPKKVLEDAYKANYSICAYWDLSLRNYKGGWSSKGCRYSRTLEGRDICTCDHLTNFAILLDYYGQNHLVSAHHQLWLSIITIIGLVLSIAGLSLTVISFILFSKLRQGLPQQTLVNLALAMLCSWIVFLAGVNSTESHDGCLVVAVLLHYFIMASFMWMLMEGVLQYLLFVKVLGVYFHKYMLKTTIVAWGVPLIPVCTMLGIDVQLYDGGEIYCWMSLTGFYYGFAVPIGLIILSNFVIYTMVTYKICTRKKLNTSGNSNMTVTNIRASFCSFIILGCSWVFGFLAISDARVVFQYIFTILNSLQGFFIFLLFTLRDQKVRDYWRNLCCKATPPGKSNSSTNSSNYLNKNDIKFSDMTEDKQEKSLT